MERAWPAAYLVHMSNTPSSITWRLPSHRALTATAAVTTLAATVLIAGCTPQPRVYIAKVAPPTASVAACVSPYPYYPLRHPLRQLRG